MEREAKRNFYISIVFLILFTLLAGFLLYRPNITYKIIATIFEAILALVALELIYRYIKRENKEDMVDSNLIAGIILIILAIIFFVYIEAFKSIFPIMVGALLILVASFKFKFTKHLMNNNNSLYKVTLIMNIILIIIGIITIFSFLAKVLENNQILAIFLWFYSIINFILAYVYKLSISAIPTMDIIEKS